MSQEKRIYGRRIRIECAPVLTPAGYHVSITDADTGEAIPNVAAAVIYLKPDEVNEVCLTYWVSDSDGRIMVIDGDAKEQKAIVSNPEIDLTAYERADKAEYIERKEKKR